MSFISKYKNTLQKYLNRIQIRGISADKRYQGYVNFFDEETESGAVVRDDCPEKEYFFHTKELYTEFEEKIRYKNTISTFHILKNKQTINN